MKMPATLIGNVLVIGLGLALLNGATVLVQPLRAVIVFPLALLVPGRALLLSVFPHRTRVGLDRVAMAVVSSAAMYPLLGLLLALFAVRITKTSLLAAVDVLVVSLLVLASARTTIAGVRPEGVASKTQRDLVRLWTGILIFAITLGVGCIFLVRAFLPPPHAHGTVALALAGSSARIASVQVVAPGRRASVDVAVINEMGSTRRFRLDAAIGGTRWKGRVVTVRPHNVWKGTLRGTIPRTSCPRRLLVSLRELGDGSEVRTVTAYFRTTKRQPPGCHA